MARTLPSSVPVTSESVAHLCPVDAYTSDLKRSLVYVEAEGTTDNITAVYCKSTLTSGKNEWGVAGYFETHIGGTQSGHTYGFGSWINVDAGATLNGSLVVPFEGGVYTSEAQASARIVLMQLQAILSGAPNSLHVFRVNCTQDITALFAFANQGSAGYTAGSGTTSSKLGDIALADIVGVNSGNPVYVRVYDSAG